MSLASSLLLALFAPAQAQSVLEDATADAPTVGFGAVESAIINGEAASSDDYPMAGGMILDATLDFGSWGSQQFRGFVCSSTLIAPDVVLLASHCLDEAAFTYGYGTMEDVVVHWTRQADLTDQDGQSIAPYPDDAVEAWDWVTHPNFDIYSLQAGLATNYDVALLFLDTPVLDVPHAYLPTPEEGALLQEGMDLAVVGWGQQVATGPMESPEPGTYAIKMQGMSHLSILAEGEFKVGEESEDVRKCHGDSGGPSFAWFPDDTLAESMRVVGVTSHAYDDSDCNRTGGVDTRVDAYLDWIDAELRARCEDGTRAWCEEPGIVPVPLAEVEEPEPEVEESDEKARLLGCSSAPGAPAPWGLGLLLFGAVALARRR
ncbi:MAG: trypsin-like serine protease [Alphaproteobacteria bacterium]|nr:trypsin-like serine protease [Alphaproteobacteria bacterium]